MKKQNKFYLSAVYLLGLFFLLNFRVVLASDAEKSCYSDPAVKEVKNVVDKILVELEKNKNEVSGNSQLVYKIIDKLMVPKADFKVMSSLVLTRNWKKLNEEQKNNFIKEFSRLIIRTYGVAFEAYNGETVDVHCPLRKLSDKNDRVEVSSTIHHLKQPENLVKFRLIKVNSGAAEPKGSSSAGKCEACKAMKQECQDLYKKCSDIKDQAEKSTESQAEQLKQNYAACKTEYNQCKEKYNTCKNNNNNKNECGKNSSPGATVEGDGVWKVYDLIVDNVSIIDSYRQVFADKFRKQNDVNKIIADMYQKNCEKNKSFCDK